jgi:hypothetical protein
VDLDVVAEGGGGVVKRRFDVERTFSSGTPSMRKKGPAPSWSTTRFTVASMSSTT